MTQTPLTRSFHDAAVRTTGHAFSDYAALRRWSVELPDGFRRTVPTSADVASRGYGRPQGTVLITA